jgi:hypothetical protein
MSVLQVSPDSSVFGSRGGVTGVVPSYQCGKRRPDNQDDKCAEYRLDLLPRDSAWVWG